MSDNLAPRRRWYQITVGRVIVATFWMAVSFAAVAGSIAPRNGRPPSDDVVILLTAIAILAPFVALGTLFGHPVWGLLIGIASIIACFMALVSAMQFGWISLPSPT